MSITKARCVGGTWGEGYLSTAGNAMESMALLVNAPTIQSRIWGWVRCASDLGRCFSALHGRAKETAVVCRRSDGVRRYTGRNNRFAGVNGYRRSAAARTRGISCSFLRERGAWRFCPQSEGFISICRLFRDLLDGRIDCEMLSAKHFPKAWLGICRGFFSRSGVMVWWAGSDQTL